MANYKNLNIEFIERTLHLISQYEAKMHEYPFGERYNHTLLINCLMGAIVLPKEKVLAYAPTEKLTASIKNTMGIQQSTFNDDIADLYTLIKRLRNAVAHFSIEFKSDDDEAFLIDKIVFYDHEHQQDYLVATFIPGELLSFIRYYGYWLTHNIRRYGIETSDQ